MESLMYHNTSSYWFNRVIMVMILLGGILMYRRLFPRQKEFFSQKSPFVLRQDNDVYDTFYLSYYDELHATESYCDDDITYITDMTSPDKKSVFLDIGCGTGNLLKRLEDKDILAFGVDKSAAMEEASKKRVRFTEIYCVDVLADPMLYDNKTFSHITCTHFTIYEIENKEQLIKYCFNWLQCGGYFIVHLVDPDKFRKVSPSIATDDELWPTVTKTNIINQEYTYRSEFKPKNKNYLFTETFTDKYTEKVRQNQSNLFMETKQNIVNMATKCGFILHKETVYKNKIKDPHQYLVIFVKPTCGDY